MDYKKIGLKAGIEIHQQTDTHKLFCNCPSTIRDDDPHFKVKRKLKSVIGETGEIDIAAAHEERKEKFYEYEGYSDTTCQIEIDEQPPNEMNKDALNISLQVALMLKSKIIDNIQVMRKIVVDGSNTTGFQRTALVAVNGSFKTSEGEVSVPSISIEEDACRKIRQDKDSVTYRLDRLGIPLIEIGTGPDLRSPEQVKEAAAYLGMVLRSTGKVKRGLGTIRQDVNVSVKGGQRVEVKGAQDLKMIPTLVKNECQRQLQLIKIKDKIKSTKIKNEKTDISQLFKDCDSKIIKSALDNKGIILALKLPNFATFLGLELQPGKRLGTELSDRAKVAAGVGGLFHSDELPKYGIEQVHVDKINKLLDCKKTDAFILVADSPRKSELALDAVVERANMVSEGVPKEVRKANQDGTTTFLRPMPGAARMYPETDSPPIRPDVKGIEIPELLTDTSESFAKKFNLGKDLANLLTKLGKHSIFEKYCIKFKNIKPSFIAETMLSAKKNVKKQFNTDISPTDQDFEDLFIHLDKGKISKDSILDILKQLNDKPIQDIIVEFELMSDKELEKQIKDLISKNKDLPFNALIGKAMAQLKGKADGRKIMEYLKKHANQ